MLSSYIWSFVPFIAGSRCLGVVRAEAMVVAEFGSSGNG